MPFPARGAAPAAATAPASPIAPPPPAAPGAPPAPIAPPAPVAPERNFYAHVNGMSTLVTETQARALPPTTQIMPQDQSAPWAAVSAVFAVLSPAQAAATGMPQVAGLGRSAFTPPATGRPGTTAVIGAPKGLFAGVPNAEVMRKGAYLMQGDYVGKICAAEFKQGRQKNHIIIEVEIIASLFDATKPETAECNREGSRATIFIHMNDSFAGNIKEIVLAVSGFDQAGKPRDVHDTVTQEECEALISPEQPYAGAYVYLEARQIATKAGGEFTRVQWWPMPMKPSATDPGKLEPHWDKLMTEVR